jgi:hypothetical protein
MRGFHKAVVDYCRASFKLIQNNDVRWGRARGDGSQAPGGSALIWYVVRRLARISDYYFVTDGMRRSGIQPLGRISRVWLTHGCFRHAYFMLCRLAGVRWRTKSRPFIFWSQSSNVIWYMIFFLLLSSSLTTHACQTHLTHNFDLYCSTHHELAPRVVTSLSCETHHPGNVGWQLRPWKPWALAGWCLVNQRLQGLEDRVKCREGCQQTIDVWKR